MRKKMGNGIRKLNCWEFKRCGRQPDGVNVSTMGLCPAAMEENLGEVHDGTNAGRACWVVSGTLCGGEVQGTFAKKFRNCKVCDFYLLVKEEEYPNFHYSAPLLEKIMNADKKLV